MRPYNQGMRRALLVLLLVLCAAAPAARAEDERPGPVRVAEDDVLLGSVVSDPGGEATRLAREAASALTDDDHPRAYELLADLVDRHGDVLLPLRLFGARRYGRTNGALRWPARRGANLAIARLPAHFRELAGRRWSARIAALETAARRGEIQALETLAASYGVTPQGSSALLLLAQRDLERGRMTRAARRYESWMELNEHAPESARAAVALRLADVLAELDDAGALAALGVFSQELREVPVAIDGGTTTIAERIATFRERPAAAAPPAPAVPPPGSLKDPVLLWSRSIRDELFLRHGVEQVGLGVTAGAWGRDDTLVLHEGRVVRRLDASTGLERWRFPVRPAVTIHAPSERYQGYDLPWRSVTPAGDAVLVVLGDPAATGRYTFLEEEYEADQLGQECRPRLVCLDLETGALRWHTGGVDDTHPVLGHRATGCSSPPLVVGRDVYCLFARRLGATTFFLACLDLQTGAPRWVVPLAAGESGRGDDQSIGIDRFTSPYAQSVPFGARPTLAEGEVCVVPHAGFAAGVDAATGEVDWVRALPRYLLNVTVPASEGQNVENRPLAWGDAWILAPMDSPRLLCLARGSGDLRWQRGEPTPADTPEWRDLLGIARDRAGRPHLRLSGWRPYRMDPASGALLDPSELPQWETDGDDPRGAACDMGPYVLRAAAGALQVRAWEATGEDAVDAVDLALDPPGAPRGGDLLRVGRTWIVVGRERVAAFAAPQDVRGGEAVLVAPGGRSADGTDAARRAAELAVRARLDADPAWLEAALEAAAPLRGGALAESVHAFLAEEARGLVEVFAEAQQERALLRRVAAVVRRLPPRHQGVALREICERFFEIDAGEDGARLLVAWLESATDDLVPLEDASSSWMGGNAVRGDLIAGRQLRAWAEDPAVRAVLEEREARQEALVAEALARGTSRDVRAALRRAAGTRVADATRRLLLARAAAAGRTDEAAALAADLRLDPPWIQTGAPEAERIAEAAQLQMREAAFVAQGGDEERARELAADLERWAPGGLKDDRGRTQTELRADLRRAFGWHPTRGGAPTSFDAWRGMPAAQDREETRSVEFLPLTGPGAAGVEEEFVCLVRGLTFELWSRKDGLRVAELPGPDEGWFGGRLASVDNWVPGGGILVSSIVAGEPADRSGVRDGDWVRTWDGDPVEDLPTFMQRVAASEPGKTVPVGIWRDGRQVLDAFRAGRRPAGQGRLLGYSPLWVDERGRILTPGRTGLAWVEPRARTRAPCWDWREPGVLRRVDVLGGRAYAVISRGLVPDLVVAVDPASGREVWRREVSGTVTWMEAVGSALWIHALSPGSALVVDRRDGTPRARLRTFDRHRGEFRKNWEPDQEADVACGRGYVVSGSDRVHVLRVINTTTCSVEHTDAWEYHPTAGVREYVNPQVSAGPFVAVLRGGDVRLYFPDPLGGSPRHVLDLSEKDTLANQTQFGSVDRDARIYIRGSTLYMVRVPIQGRRNVNIAVFGVDYAALGQRDPTDRDGGGSVLPMRTDTRLMGGPTNPRRYVLNIRAREEGILVSAASLTGDHTGETWWVSAMEAEGDPDNLRLRLLEQPMSDARRHPPVRIGDSLFVPTDEGALVYPVTRYAPR